MREELGKEQGRRLRQRDIAAHAGVSVSTVSRVLSNSGNISSEVTQRILSVVAELGYQREHLVSAYGLRKLGLFTSSINLGSSLDPFHSDVLTGIENECQRNHLTLLYTLLEGRLLNSKTILSKIKQNQIDGVLLMSVDDHQLVESLIRENIRTVVINAEHPTLPVDTFLPNNEVGPLLAMNYLFAHGHRRILHITNLKRRTLQRRFRGYQAALEEAALPFDPSLVLDCQLDTETSRKAVTSLLKSGTPDFTAVFCSGDLAAIGAIQAVREAGYDVPKDISVVGYDDIQIASYLDPPLTTVRIEREELGMRAVRGLLERAVMPNWKPVRVEVATSLVERNSVTSIL